MDKILICKGASASGKSTRVQRILEYFQHIGIELEDYYYTDINGLRKIVGVKVMDILFIGQISKKKKIFRGFDDVGDYFIKIQHFFDFLKENKDEMMFVIEGSGVVITNKLRPEYLNSEMGISELLMQYYIFDSEESFAERKFMRSGAVGVNGYARNELFIGEYKKTLEENKYYPEENIHFDMYDAPEFDLGVKFFEFIGSDEDVVLDFIDFCENRRGDGE